MTNLTVNQFNEMIGQTIISVSSDNDTLMFKTNQGRTFTFYHSQDCCESVFIEYINGDLNDLIGSPLLVAEEVSNEEDTNEEDTNEEDTNEEDTTLPDITAESYTWTFYKFATVNGWVDVRWLGTSNGYYSESVSFKDSGDKA